MSHFYSLFFLIQKGNLIKRKLISFLVSAILYFDLNLFITKFNTSNSNKQLDRVGFRKLLPTHLEPH